MTASATAVDHPDTTPPGQSDWPAPGLLRGVAAVYRWEMAKLVRQLRVHLALGLCVLGPIGFVLVQRSQSTLPTDTPFGRQVHDSGFAVALVVLGFAGLWAVPALASVVAGDTFAAEDRFGTWTTILTRSRSRAELFAGKSLAAMTYTLTVVLLLGTSSILASLLFVGRQPLVGLSGQSIPPGRALALLCAAWASVLLPALAFTALALLVSVVTRSGPAGVGVPVVAALAMQIYGLVDGPELVRFLLVSSPFSAWYGLFVEVPFYGPLGWGAATSLLWLAGCLTVAAGVFGYRRRTAG